MKLQLLVTKVDADLLEEPLGETSATIYPIEATRLSREVDAPKAAALILLGAFAHATGIVGADALDAALAGSLPSYRHQFLEANRRALAAGRDAAGKFVHARPHRPAPGAARPEDGAGPALSPARRSRASSRASSRPSAAPPPSCGDDRGRDDRADRPTCPDCTACADRPHRRFRSDS